MIIIIKEKVTPIINMIKGEKVSLPYLVVLRNKPKKEPLPQCG